MSTSGRVPRISVLMPVHNAGAFLDEALGSLAAQTFRDFELVAVDDASGDGGAERLSEWGRRVAWLRMLRRPEQGGVAAALNTGLAQCRGEFVARMDADDIAMPDRLARQLEFLDRHADVGMCGGRAMTFGAGDEALIRPPETDEAIRAWLVFGSAFVHPTVMLRREVLDRAGGRYRTVLGVEDYELWLRLAEVTRLANLPEPLLRYRVHAGQYTAAKPDSHHRELHRLRLDWLTGKGIAFDAEEARAHDAVAIDPGADEALDRRRVAAWLRRLLRELPAVGWCGPGALRKTVAERWWAWADRGPRGLRAAFGYAVGPLAGFGKLELRRVARLLAGANESSIRRKAPRS